MHLNLQDAYLGQMKKDNQMVIVHLMNGFQLKGTIRGFDNFTIFMEDETGKFLMIYKHAVTTVKPTRNTSLSFLSEAFKEAQSDRGEDGG